MPHAADDQTRNDQRLLGVIGHRPCRHAGSDGLICNGITKDVDPAAGSCAAAELMPCVGMPSASPKDSPVSALSMIRHEERSLYEPLFMQHSCSDYRNNGTGTFH